MKSIPHNAIPINHRAPDRVRLAPACVIRVTFDRIDGRAIAAFDDSDMVTSAVALPVHEYQVARHGAVTGLRPLIAVFEPLDPVEDG